MDRVSGAFCDAQPLSLTPLLAFMGHNGVTPSSAPPTLTPSPN